MIYKKRREKFVEMFAKKENKKKQNKCEENLIIFEIVYFITIVAFVYGMEK